MQRKALCLEVTCVFIFFVIGISQPTQNTINHDMRLLKIEQRFWQAKFTALTYIKQMQRQHQQQQRPPGYVIKYDEKKRCYQIQTVDHMYFRLFEK